MSDQVYRKYALDAEDENRIELTDSQQIVLRDALDRQIIQHKISGLSQEVLHAIFHKTIRHNKREDDLNGTCLSNLTSTGSRPDYVNRHVRELIAQSILIARLGHYGRILSINFNFEQWGKSPEENGTLTSDPESLIIVQKALQNAENTEVLATTQSASAETTVTSELHPPSNTATLENAQITGLKEAIQVLSNELGAVKTLLRQVLPGLATQNEAQTITSDLKPDEICEEESRAAPKTTETSCETHSDTKEESDENIEAQTDIVHNNKPPALTSQATQEPCEIHSHKDRENEKKDKPSVLTSQAIQESCKTHSHKGCESEKTADQKKPCENESSILTPLTSQEPCEAHDHEALVFPKELKAHEKRAICKALEDEDLKDKSICQLLLDDLSSRFTISDWQPIRSPIAYFKSLIRSYQKGTFDRSYVDNFRTQRKIAEETQREQQEQQQKQQGNENRRVFLDKYNEAKNNYEQLKFAAYSLGLSLREMAKRLGWTSLIEEMGFDLDAPVPVFD